MGDYAIGKQVNNYGIPSDKMDAEAMGLPGDLMKDHG